VEVEPPAPDLVAEDQREFGGVGVDPPREYVESESAHRLSSAAASSRFTAGGAQSFRVSSRRRPAWRQAQITGAMERERGGAATTTACK
jgi:hypothetical protein